MIEVEIERVHTLPFAEIAKGTFPVLLLRTNSEEAAAFYERLGFTAVDAPHHTHRWAAST